MGLVRHRYPSPNYSPGLSSRRLLVIHTTEGFTGPNGMYDCAVYFQGPVGASSHVVVDAFHPGHICECVTAGNAAWCQCGYNSQVWGCVEQCAYASWPRELWLGEKMPMLENTAAWLAEESARSGIPLTKLTPGQAQGSARGVCYHSDLGSAGCGHSDPGAGYPIDIVLELARGGGPAPGPPREDDDDMPYLTIPPLGGQPAIPHELSLDGMHSSVGLCTDASTHPSSTGLRVACHTAPRRWVTANIWSDNQGPDGHEKIVYRPVDSAGKAVQFDGIRVDRLDTNNTVVTINVGRLRPA